MFRFKFSLFFVFLLGSIPASAQDEGRLSGSFLLNANFYDRDEKIETNTTHYLHELSSAEAWLDLNYVYRDWKFILRYDLYLNSPVLNPQEAYTAQGPGFYSIQKKIDNLDITVGHFYDQIGSGIIFRAFEERIIGLDYAIRGARVNYEPIKNLYLKGFTGQQKNRFDIHPQVIMGANAEYYARINDSLSFTPGAGIVKRTLDQQTMLLIADEINSYPLGQRFIPKYNSYSYTFYNRLNYRNIGIYAEYAGRTPEAVRLNDNLLDSTGGSVIFGGINYSRKGLGISLQYKRINNFVHKTSPYTQLLEGRLGYIPPLSRQHAYRLVARYNTTAIEFGEQGFQGEITWTPKKDNTFLINYSDIRGPGGIVYYTELYVDYYRKFSRNFKSHQGIQMINYNQDVYELKPGVPIVQTFVPFFEGTYNITRRKALRLEAQYMWTERNRRINEIVGSDFNETGRGQDHGDFVFVQIEYTVAPKWSVSLSDMVNTRPVKLDEETIHYYSVFGSYTHRQSRYSLAYVKQVEGVVCTGGICRIEPAFSGLRFTLNTNF